jgi:hypothetical protein
MLAKTKPRRRGTPHKVLRVTTYEKLEQYLRAFADGYFNLLILVGDGGLAKSRSVKAALNGKACWIEGNASPFGMYVKLYLHRDQFVVIDDVDALYADRSGARLLKCLCQTEEEKAVAWHSDARGLERHCIPREFTTSSRVVIISNDWRTLNKNVAALQDRGHVLLSSQAGPRCTARPRRGSRTRRFTTGSARTCTASGGRPCAITCAPASLRPPAWIGPRCSPPRVATTARGWPASCWPALPTAAPPSG